MLSEGMDPLPAQLSGVFAVILRRGRLTNLCTDRERRDGQRDCASDLKARSCARFASEAAQRVQEH